MHTRPSVTTLAHTPAPHAQSEETHVKADGHALTGPSQLGLWDAVSVIIGIVIGAGIYETGPLVFANSANAGQALAFWTLGGVLSLIGACCYAELASTYPRSGGDYVYLSRAFGRVTGFLFGWAQLAVILTGSIGMMAYVFADYAVALWGKHGVTATLLAASSVLALTIVNVMGVAGKVAQNVLSFVKVVGLLAVIVAGFAFGSVEAPHAPPTKTEGSMGLAMIFVLYTFGGWNDAAFVASEVRDRKRNLPRALLLGTLAITVIYLLINAAFISALGFEGARASKAVAADVLHAAFGSIGAIIISVIVMISALGAVNGLIFTGSRVYASLGADYSALSGLGRWHPRLGSPVWSLLTQLAITVAMISIVGTDTGRRAVDATLTSVGLQAASWSGHGGFDTLLRCTAPVFWLFFLLTSISLFVLRRKDPDLERPFRVPLYPFLPLIFTATAGYMLYSAIDYAGRLTLIGLLPLVIGLPVYALSKRKPLPASNTAQLPGLKGDSDEI
jgi:amino acid transporter